MSSGLPPDAQSGVFFVHLTREIDAPLERVVGRPHRLAQESFRVGGRLSVHCVSGVDSLSNVGLVRAMTIVNASKQADAEQTLVEGKHLLMKCHVPPSTNDAAPPRRPQCPFERVTVVDAAQHRLAWVNIDYPAWALRAERWQTLTVLDGGRTRYETWEVFGGILAYAVKWFVGKPLRESFDAFADGLKTRSESA
ncbi:hypothetical protein DFH11DRAFT_1546044 [Phellopilus nigrolimitatus]|nr:hypothetical protein DFH11DRAFT_1546044 [Phellopilus nigrolimitatus]